jgi:RNA polymerase sigma factor (sigma-70 family)
MDRTAEQEVFQSKLLAALARSPPAHWVEVWNLYLEDPWIQSELTKEAHFVLRATGGPIDWLHDVRNETVLILAAKLENSPSLGLDVQGFTDGFPAFISTVIANASKQALKRLRRIYRTGVALSEDLDFRAASAFYDLYERLLDLSTAIEELPEPLCSILRLYLLGYRVRAISCSLGIKPWSVYRILKRGVEQLRQDLLCP